MDKVNQLTESKFIDYLLPDESLSVSKILFMVGITMVGGGSRVRSVAFL